MADDNADITPQLGEALTEAVTDEDIRTLLTRLLKIRVSKLIDTYAAHNMEEVSITVVGISPLQIMTIRRWVEETVVARLLDILDSAVEEPETPPTESGSPEAPSPSAQ